MSSKDYYNIRDSYKYYTGKVSLSEFVKINNTYMKFLADKLITTGFLRLPLRCGTIEIAGKKPKVTFEGDEIKGLAPDWKNTLLHWEKNPEAMKKKELIYHFNEETNGIRYRFRWSKKGVLIPNKLFYYLVMTRANKRRLSGLIQQGKEYKIL